MFFKSLSSTWIFFESLNSSLWASAKPQHQPPAASSTAPVALMDLETRMMTYFHSTRVKWAKSCIYTTL